MQWWGQLLQWPEEYFPGEVQGEKDCDVPGQERRNTSTWHSSSRMKDSLLARSRLSSCPSTSLQQQRQKCIYRMYIFQIQIFSPRFGLAISSQSSHSCSKSSGSLHISSPLQLLCWWDSEKWSLLTAVPPHNFTKHHSLTDRLIRSDRISMNQRNPDYACLIGPILQYLLISFNSGKLRCIQVSSGKFS